MARTAGNYFIRSSSLVLLIIKPPPRKAPRPRRNSAALVSLHYFPSSIRQVGVIFLVTVVCGLTGRSAAGEPSAPKKVATVEGITEYQFDNGLRLLLFPDNSQSKVSGSWTRPGPRNPHVARKERPPFVNRHGVSPARGA